MDQVSLRHKRNTLPPQGGAPAAPAQLSGGGVPNSAMAEAIGGGYQSNMSGLEANMNQRMQAIQHPAAVSAVQQSVPLGTVQMLPGDGQDAPAQEEEVSFWSHPILYIRNKWRRYKARKAEEDRIEAARKLKQSRNRKKAWEMTSADFANNEYNPGDKDEITAIQRGIDEAETPEAAFQVFNGGRGRLTFKSETARQQLDVQHFKRRLKNMTRMVVDYPELKDLVEDMLVEEKDKTSGATMYTRMKQAGGPNAEWTGSRIGYVAENGAPVLRTPQSHNATAEYSGNHELGHILNGHLIALKMQDQGQGYRFSGGDWVHDATSNAMLRKVIRNVYGVNRQVVNKDGERLDIRRQKKRPRLRDDITTEEYTRYLDRNRIDMNRSGFRRDLTGSYGRTNAREFFAEAFADVYGNGATAKKSSIELVKQYERRRDKLKKRIERRGQRAGRQNREQ